MSENGHTCLCREAFTTIKAGKTWPYCYFQRISIFGIPDKIVGDSTGEESSNALVTHIILMDLMRDCGFAEIFVLKVTPIPDLFLQSSSEIPMIARSMVVFSQYVGTLLIQQEDSHQI